MFGPNVSILTTGHPVEPSPRRAGVVARPIAIERNVWIGAGAIVIGGVTVGENSVVGAGAVVTRDVPRNTFVGGNPARVIRPIGEAIISAARRERPVPRVWQAARKSVVLGKSVAVRRNRGDR